MKVIFKITGENVRSYNPGTKGYEFIDTCEDVESFYDKITTLEDPDIFEGEKGFLNDASGNEIFDPAYPNRFDFTDYNYYVEDVDSLDDYFDGNKIKSIKNAKPFNLVEILERVHK